MSLTIGARETEERQTEEREAEGHRPEGRERARWTAGSDAPPASAGEPGTRRTPAALILAGARRTRAVLILARTRRTPASLLLTGARRTRAALALTGGQRTRAALALTWPLARAIDWAPLAAVAVFTAALVSLVEMGSELSAGTALDLMRVGGALLGGAAAFALVDPVATNAGPAPVPRWVRQGLRCLLAGAVAMAIWLGAFAVVVSRLPRGQLFPLSDLLVEAVVCLGTGLAAAATAARFTSGRQLALAAVVAQLMLVLATVLLPAGLQLWPPTCGYGHWYEAHRFWLVMSPLPLLWLAVANRDVR